MEVWRQQRALTAGGPPPILLASLGEPFTPAVVPLVLAGRAPQPSRAGLASMPP
jgi:hypothetical protein